MFLLMPVVILAIPFWTMGLLMRYCSSHFTPSAASWESVIEFDSCLGWKPRSNLNAHCSFVAGTFHVKTDSQGWRGKGNIEQCHVLAIGDSVAFGFGVNDDDAFFSRINSGLRVKAVGAPGYNMVQEVLWLEKLAPQLRGKLVVWFICLGNDLYDNIIPNLYQYRMPFVRKAYGTDTWEVVTEHIKKERWPYNAEANRRLTEKWEATFSERYLGQRAYSACAYLLKRGRDACARVGAGLVVMTVPLMNQFDPQRWERTFLAFGGGERFDPDLPDRKIGEICAQLNVSFLSGRDYVRLADHIERDGHWNEFGHDRIARLLQSLHERHLSGGDPSLGKMASSVPLLPLQQTP
jgi:hypothetical protein